MAEDECLEGSVHLFFRQGSYRKHLTPNPKPPNPNLNPQTLNSPLQRHMYLLHRGLSSAILREVDYRSGVDLSVAALRGLGCMFSVHQQTAMNLTMT